MFNKDEYVNDIFRKYHQIHSKKIKKTHKVFSIKRFVEVASIGILSLGVGVFAYTGVVQKNFIKQSSEVAEGRVEGYGNMPHAYNANIENYKIKTMEEYNDFKEVHPGLLEMKEEDFENSFLFVLWDSGEIKITNIESTDTELKIEIERDVEKEQKLQTSSEPKVLSTKILNELDREKVRIDEYIKMTTIGGIKPMKEVLGYTKEELIKEGYIVVEQGGKNRDGKYNLISNNQEKLDKFIEDVNNKKDAMIRVVKCGREHCHFYDFKYTDDVIYMYEYYRPEKYDIKGMKNSDVVESYILDGEIRGVKETIDEFLETHPLVDKRIC